MKQSLCSTLIAGLFVTGIATAHDGQDHGAAAVAKSAQSGVDKNGVDQGVRAQDDFFRHSQGNWLKTVAIPDDRASWGAFNVASDAVDQQLKTIIEEASNAPNKVNGSDAQKVGDLYASFMDMKRRDAQGLAPLKGELAKISALNDKKGIAALMAHFEHVGVSSPINMGVGQDSKASTNYIVSLGQSGLSLPSRDYYLKKDDAKMVDVLAKYQLHVEKLLSMAGHKDAAAEAKQIVEFETEIAKLQWSAVELRDPIKRYNKLSFAQLQALAPNIDWNAFYQGAGIAGKADHLIVGQPNFVSGIDALFQKTPLDVIKVYFEAKLIGSYAPMLSQAYVDESFAFRGAVLSGTKVNRTLQKRGIATVDGVLGEIVGKLYVKNHFPPERKAQVEAIAKNFLAAFKDGIELLEWMSPETKKEAQVKLSKINVKIGYPNKWIDYSPLVITPDDLIGNLMRSRSVRHEQSVARLGRPIDRDVWGMTPQTVNAYYNAGLNEIVFPAARLQSPLYDTNAEPAINYGAVGISIGHEISHAFDDKGSQYDGDGNLRDWWTKDDKEKFAARAKVLVAQYNGYSPVAGYTINGELTLGENIADNAGLIMATRAYKLSQGGKAGPVIDGFTAEQRIFMGMAQARRSKAREQALISQVKSDPHSPGEFRVNGSLRNHPGYYEAFNVKPGDQMYLAPEQRVIFW
jgi:putative endopeptidase